MEEKFTEKSHIRTVKSTSLDLSEAAEAIKYDLTMVDTYTDLLSAYPCKAPAYANVIEELPKCLLQSLGEPKLHKIIQSNQDSQFSARQTQQWAL